MPILLIAVGGALLLLAFATSIPLLAAVGVGYLLSAWALHTKAVSRRWKTFGMAVAGVFVALGVIAATGMAYLWWNSAPPTPDAFYDAPSAVPPTSGTLLRFEPFNRALPPDSRAWRILYTTTRSKDVPAVASAVVLASTNPSSEPRSVIAWAHGTTGVVPGCAPTVLPAPFPFDATLPALEELMSQNWVLVGTDYVGPGTRGPHPYLIGEDEARSTLDAVRAARHIKELTLDDRAVIWGHSQGGHAALWTGILAPRYAPDVKVMGVAALAPATEVAALVEAAQHTPVGKMMSSYVITAYSETYPDVSFNDYVGPTIRGRALAGRCLSGRGALLSLLVSVTLERSFFALSPSDGPLGERFRQNTPYDPIAAPVLIAQGLGDDLVLPAVQERFVRQRCDSGQSLEYRTYEGRDHVGLVAPDSPLIGDLLQWTHSRLAGTPTEAGCRTVSR